jgi:hypothetical protein
MNLIWSTLYRSQQHTNVFCRDQHIDWKVKNATSQFEQLRIKV